MGGWAGWRGWVAGWFSGWAGCGRTQKVNEFVWRIEKLIQLPSLALIRKSRAEQSRKNFYTPLSFYVSLSCEYVCVSVCLYLHTHWQAFYLLMISHFAYGTSLLFVLFVLLCFLQLAHTYTIIHIFGTGAKLLTDVVVDFLHFPLDPASHSLALAVSAMVSFSRNEKRRKLSKKRKDLFRFDQN